jgi:hypothetical protein
MIKVMITDEVMLNWKALRLDLTHSAHQFLHRAEGKRELSSFDGTDCHIKSLGQPGDNAQRSSFFGMNQDEIHELNEILTLSISQPLKPLVGRR